MMMFRPSPTCLARAVLPAVLTLLIFLPGAAFASLDASRFSDSERVGFAFAKLTNTQPDFSAWVRAQPDWQKARPSQRENVMETNVARLQDGLTNYDGTADLIHAAAKVTVTWDPEASTGAASSGPAQEKMQDITVAFKKPGAVFTYMLGGQRIDVMPEQIDDKVSFMLKPAEFDDFVQAAGSGGAAEATIEFYLEPEKADAANPALVRGSTVYPLIVRVAHLRLWTEDHAKILWNYDAPWYADANSRRLNELYDR